MSGRASDTGLMANRRPKVTLKGDTSWLMQSMSPFEIRVTFHPCGRLVALSINLPDRRGMQ